MRNRVRMTIATLALSAFVAGCSAGGSVPYAGLETTTESGTSTPTVTSTTKTSNASISPGTVQVFLTMSEALVTAPSVSVEALDADGVAAAAESDGTTPCVAYLEDQTFACPISVAGCMTVQDYRLTFSGGVNTDGSEMEAYTMTINSLDDEFGSANSLLDAEGNEVCWTFFEDPEEDEPVIFEEVAEVEIVGNGLLQWTMLTTPEDMAEANLSKTFPGTFNMAVTIWMVDSGLPSPPSSDAYTGLHFNPAAEPYSLSGGYHTLVLAPSFFLAATTYTDDFNGTFYQRASDSTLEDAYPYACIVLREGVYDYYVSADGQNFIKLTSTNMEDVTEMLAGSEPGGGYGSPTPIDAGLLADDYTTLCNPNGDYDYTGPPENDPRPNGWTSLEDCYDYARATQAAVDTMTLEQLMAYASPIIRIYANASAGASTPAIDFARFKASGLVGNASDCPRVY